MTLAQVLEDQFRGDIRFRGMAYLKDERVTIARATTDDVFGLVTDGIEFHTHLTRNDGLLQMTCSCVKEGRPPIPCKHLWATILAADAGRLVSETIRPGHVPPFQVEDELVPLNEPWEDDSRRDVYEPPRQSRLTREAILAQPPLKGWEAQLQKLDDLVEGDTPASPAAERKPRQIFYEIDPAATRDRGVLVIQIVQRQRRANGQWGKCKPLKLRSGRLDLVDHDDDRRILSYLLGGSPERSGWIAQQMEASGGSHRFQIPFELSETVLPLICATKRLRLAGDEPDDTTELIWDEGPPWELALEVVPEPVTTEEADLPDTSDEDDGNDDEVITEVEATAAAVAETPEVVDDDEEEAAPEPGWRLEGKLRRGYDSLPLTEPAAIVPGGFVVARRHISRLRDFGAFAWARLLRSDGAVEIPRGEGAELVDRLLDMPLLPRLDLPPELKLEEVRVPPVPQLTLRTPKGVRWKHERLAGEIHFLYEGAAVRSTSPQGAIVQRLQGRCLPRDREREETSFIDLQELGFRRLNNTHGGGSDVELPAKSLGHAVRGLIRLGRQVRADGQQVRQPGVLNFEVKTGIDWFELHGDVDFEGRSVAFPELLAALARGDCTVRLDDGSLGILPEEWMREFGLLSGLGVTDGDHVRFAQNQVGLLDALLTAQESVQFDEKFTELQQRVKSFQGIQLDHEPEGFHGLLRPYQREGVGWLHFLHDFKFGGCLADDMGLGKTIQLLALLQRLHQTDKKCGPTLVVVPKSLIFNWHNECQRFIPDLSVMEYTGLHRTRLRKKFTKTDVILTTYGTVRRDIMHLREVQFGYVVLDEAQSIKNAGSQVSKAVRLLRAEHRLALSGTPIENHLSDLWSIFEFLNPGVLGRASVFKMQTSSETAGDDSRRLLSQALRPFILRRTKKEVAKELPDKLEQTILCTMGKNQEALYNEMRDHYRASILGIVEKQGLAKSKMHVLEALLRLRQAACHPGLLDENRHEESSAKLDVLCLNLQDLLAEGHKALVFSQFTSYLAIVKKHLDQRGIVYEYLDGQTRNRQERIERFQNDTACGVFLVSLKAGGLGLNLTAADYVFLLDPWWNPAVEAQAIDRAHRLGQTRQVFAYRLICRNTVEEKIAQLQGKKKELADAILQADNNLLQEMTSEDLELLLS